VLFVQEVHEKHCSPFVSIGQEPFESSQNADDLSGVRSIAWHKDEKKEKQTCCLGYHTIDPRLHFKRQEAEDEVHGTAHKFGRLHTQSGSA